MAIKFKLSDDEKERASKILKKIEEEKDNSLKKQYNTPKEISLPTAKSTNSSGIPSYRQNISTKMDRLPTARLSTDKINSMNTVDTQNVYKIKDKNILKNVVDDIKSKAKGYVNFDNEFSDGYQLGDVSKTFLGTATDITQDFAGGRALKTLEDILDIGTNWVATGLNTGSGALGIKNEKLAKDMRNFADKDLSSTISHRVANVTPFGIAYNLANGTPEKIFNPAGIKYDINKNPIENYKAGFEKAYLTDEVEDYEKSSLSGEKMDQAVEMIGYSLGNRMYGNALSSKTGTKQIGGSKFGASISGGNIGIKIGQHTFNLPTLSFAGGMAGGLQEANSKENISEAERWTKGISSGIIEAGSEGLFGFLGVGGNDITDNIKNEFANKFPTKVGKMLAQLGVECTGESIEEFLSYAGNFLVDNGIINRIGDADFSSEWDWNEVLENMAMAFVTTGISGGGNVVITNNSSIKAVEQQIGRKLTEKEKAGVTQAVIDGTLYEKMQIKDNETFQNMEQIDNTLPVANESNRYTKTELEEMLNNKDLPMQNYIYKQSSNAKVDNLRRDASKYFNNSEQTRNYVSMLEKIVSDKNVEIRFDENLKTPDGKIANGSYSDGVITINPNSSNTGEFIAIHELTHAIGTKEMIDIIESYKESNTQFKLDVEKLLQNYNTNEINEEALADVSAQLFGNQEFINNIAQENPNIFQKIYSEIKYLWHQFIGYKNQQQFIDDLYYKWTKAYNSNNKLNNTENYLITQNDKGKYVKADRQVISGNNPSEWESQVENYINDSIRKGKDIQVTTENGDLLTITKDTSGKAKFRNQITDKNGNTRYLNNKEFLSKLTAETHIDELAQISKKINKTPIPDYKNHQFAKDGFDYRSAYFEDFDGQYYKITMSVGKNGNIDTIYNIGKMDKKNRSKSSLVAQRPSDNKITSNEELTSTNSIPSQNNNVNTTTKYSIQESENNSDSFSMQNNIAETAEMKKYTIKKPFKIADSYKIYRGISKNGNTGTAMYGEGLYTTTNKKYASEFGNVVEIEKNQLPKNPLQFKTETDFSQWEKELANSLGIRRNELYKNNSNVDKYVKKMGYDGITIGTGKDMTIVTYSLDKYSISNPKDSSWQQYLDRNFKSEGTKTKLSDIRLQTAQRNTAPSAKNNVAETSSVKNSWSAKQKEVENEEKIAKILEQPVEKAKEKDRIWAIMKANFIDKGIVFEELSHKTKNRELQGKWDYTLTASARGQNAIGLARYEMDAKTKTEKQICKGLEEIRAEVGNKANDFQNYMYHQLNIDRMTLEDRFGGDTGINYERKNSIKNKPVFSKNVTAEISQKIVNQFEQKNPEFKKLAQDVYDFNNANKQELVRNGVISQELADTLGELYPHYVPIKRVNANGSAIKVPLDTNRTGVNSPLARAKGGNSDIQPLFQTLAERTM